MPKLYKLSKGIEKLSGANNFGLNIINLVNVWPLKKSNG